MKDVVRWTVWIGIKVPMADANAFLRTNESQVLHDSYRMCSYPVEFCGLYEKSGMGVAPEGTQKGSAAFRLLCLLKIFSVFNFD